MLSLTKDGAVLGLFDEKRKLIWQAP